MRHLLLRAGSVVFILLLPVLPLAAAPPIPGNLHVGPGASCGSLLVTWNPSAGAVSYNIYYDEDTSNPPYSPTVGGAPASGASVGGVTAVQITGLTPGSTYYVAVTAVDGFADESDYSAERSSATSLAGCPPPATPTGLSANTGDNCGEVKVAFNAVPGAIGYNVYYDEDAANPPYTPTDDGNPNSGATIGAVTSITVSGLSPGVLYRFSATAFNYSGESGYAVEDTATASSTCCANFLNPISANYGPFGGSGSFDVNIGAGCNWAAIDLETWISYSSGQFGTGNGTVSYKVGINLSPAARAAKIFVAGDEFDVTQDGMPFWFWLIIILLLGAPPAP